METGRPSEGGGSPDLGGSVSAKTASCVEFLLRFFYLIQGDDATRNERLYRRISLFNSMCYTQTTSSEIGPFSGMNRHRISSGQPRFSKTGFPPSRGCAGGSEPPNPPSPPPQ